MKKTFICRVALALVICLGFATLAVSAANEGFAPSIEVKDTPTVVAPEATPEVGAIINNGEATENIAMADIVTVSYEEAKTAVDAGDNTHKALVDAYQAFKSNGVEKSIEGVASFVANELKISNPEYFVSNIFELNIGEHDSKLAGDATVTVCFSNAGINAESGKLVVAHMVGEKWVVVPNNNVKVTAETIEVTFDELCPVVFLNVKEGTAQEPSETTPSTPDETETDAPDNGGEDDGDNSVLVATIVILSITGVVIAGIVVFYVLEKKGVLAKLSQGNTKKNNKK